MHFVKGLLLSQYSSDQAHILKALFTYVAYSFGLGRYEQQKLNSSDLPCEKGWSSVEKKIPRKGVIIV